MKTTQLIITCLISTTVWALPKYPLGFFANISGTYLPLSGDEYHEFRGVGRSFLKHKTDSRYPVEFELKNNQAITYNTKSPGHLGLADGIVSFGPVIRPITLEFDDDMSVKNMSFRSCGLYGHLYYKRFPLPDPYCEDGKVYILPFNRGTGNVVENLPFAKDTSVVEKTRSTE